VDTIRIGIAQVSPSAELPANLAKTLEYVDAAADAGVDLVCFPETHLPGYRVGVLDPGIPPDEAGLARALETVAQRCRARAIGACIGTETPLPGAKPHNSAVVIGRDGEVLARHHKSQLTPRDQLGYTPGSGPTPFEFDGVAMGVVICFEGFRFPETTRALARDGAKIVLHPQFNHVLSGAAWKLPVHEALITARAAENTIFFVSANMAHPRNNCRSLVVAPDGLVQAASELGREMLISADLDLDKATHAFLKTDPADRMRALAEAGDQVARNAPVGTS
jgi:predicted amidohydrolase